jgi:hypothetical protein
MMDKQNTTDHHRRLSSGIKQEAERQSVSGSTPEPGPVLLLNYGQASRALGICERAVRNLVSRGAIPVVKLGKRTLFDVDDLRRLINANKVTR